ncbi:CMP-N-acetylneuraminate-beta-galactosamide-alpha-2,3-sialyltransferase 2-like isoform X2 [Struthio camelus]|uniref:CMP-N-acetylneuraminate-beta-galactosamide- alpha-2,3-sialyltransferase 2-like isoform X2 n=1 Tax=Struthio camelus TaxID=8801 RepID=UPI003603D880
MLCRKRARVVVALCLLLFLWQYFRAPTAGIGHFFWSPSLLDVRLQPHCTVSVNSSAWFNTRYDAAVGPLLTVRAQNLSSDVIHWWLKLQSSPSGAQLQATIQHLFAVLPSPTSSTWDASQCRTCAVVGNSGRLKGSHHGPRIDSHDWVLSTYMRVRQFIKADKNKVLILSPAFLKYIHDNWTQRHGKYPSTGFTTLLFALHACQQVSVFGFGADTKGNWHHYWEENRYSGAFRRTKVHDADVEFSIIKRLAAEGRIFFYE